MQAVEPINIHRQEHGVVFNGIAYTCGAVYALGQLALQGLGKCWEAAFDTTYECVINAGAGIYQIGKGLSYASQNVICVSQMVWGCASPFLSEACDYTCAFFIEIWKILRNLPHQIFSLIEVPGSLIGGLIKQLLSDAWSGLKQIGVFATLVFEIVRQLRDFGTLGAIVKDCIQLLEAGMYQIIHIFATAWKESALPREQLGNVLSDLVDYVVSGFNETYKLLKFLYEGADSVLAIPVELSEDLIVEVASYVIAGLNFMFLGLLDLIDQIEVNGRILCELLVDWLRELGGYLYSYVGEIFKFYDATQEDLGNTWKDMIVDPLAPYAAAMLKKINDFLLELEKAVIEVQKVIFG